jgi:hypothetical protein
MTEGKPMYGIRGGLAHDAGSGSFVSWDNTKCNPLASAREQARSAWEDGYASAKREWVGLTDEEIKPLCDENHIIYGAYTVDFIQAIEAKLKEKNT